MWSTRQLLESVSAQIAAAHSSWDRLQLGPGNAGSPWCPGGEELSPQIPDTKMHCVPSSTIHNSQEVEQPNAHQRVGKQKHGAHPLSGTLFSFKQKEALTQTTTWVILEGLLSEISLSQRDEYGVIPLM